MKLVNLNKNFEFIEQSPFNRNNYKTKQSVLKLTISIKKTIVNTKQDKNTNIMN